MVLWCLREGTDVAHGLQNDRSITVVHFMNDNYEMKKAQNTVDRLYRDRLGRDKKESYLAKLATINSVHLLAIG